MPTTIPRAQLHYRYERAAMEYSQRLTDEDLMESTVQATQRKITLASLELVRSHRPDIHVFNELLIQYPRRGETALGQVVPDNMIVVHDGPIADMTHWGVPFHPVKPFLVMEYISKSNTRKDFDTSMGKYERELKVPYYLMFHPDHQELTLFRLRGKVYGSVKPNKAGRVRVPKLELEIGLLGEWVRYWFRGELLLLPAELAAKNERDKQARAAAELNAQQERAGREAAEAEVARLRAEIERLRK